jgi:hypothetical protein
VSQDVDLFVLAQAADCMEAFLKSANFGMATFAAVRTGNPASTPAGRLAYSLHLYTCMIRVGRHFLQLFPKVNLFLFSVILRSVAVFSIQHSCHGVQRAGDSSLPNGCIYLCADS